MSAQREQKMTPIKAQLQKEARDAGWHSRGYLPHFDGGEIAQTITFRLADSLPRHVVDGWKRELDRAAGTHADSVLRKRIEAYLDQGYGLCALRNVSIAQVVQDALLHFDGERYRLSAWVIMPNHVHLMMTPCISWSLSRIMKDMKSFTSREANKLLGRRGQFWMDDYFDRYVRDAKHFANAIAYIENNPVKAGLVKTPSEWQFGSAGWRAIG
jgi:putative DNA methylase